MCFSSLVRAAVLLLTTLCMTGCALLCKGIKRGPGVTAVGVLAAGEHASHTLDLTRGAQNDVYVTTRDSVPAGITYTIYATSAACTTFSPGAEKWLLRYPVVPQDPCAIISSDTLGQMIGKPVHGPGRYVIVRDIEVSGANQFKLWIIGDPRVPISYEVKVWWASGNDC